MRALWKGNIGFGLDADLDQGFPNVLQFEGLDDRLDLLHMQRIGTSENR